MRAKPRKERVNDSVAVRRDFFCAFSAFPASSPSVPNKSARIRDFFLRFSCNSPVFFIASSGVILLNFLAGSQAEISTVKNEVRIVTANTSG